MEVDKTVNPHSQVIADRYRKSLEAKTAANEPKVSETPVVTSGNSTAAVIADKKIVPPTPADDKGTPTPTISDEEFRKKLKEEFGYEYDDAKSRLSQQPLTEEDKKKAEQNAQKAILDEYLSTEGNTIEKYNEIQAKNSRPDFDLVKERFIAENKDDLEGMTEAEIDVAFNDAYHLDTEKFSEKMTKLGQKKISKEAKAIREENLSPVKNAESSFKTKSQQKESTTKWERSVDEWVRTEGDGLRKLTYKDEKHGDIETAVPDEVFNSVVEKIKDMGKFAAYLKNADGSTNKKKLAEILIKAEMFEVNAKLVAEGAYGKGAKDAVAKFPPKPDFSNTGKQDTAANDVTDLQKKANEHNKRQRTKRP